MNRSEEKPVGAPPEMAGPLPEEIQALLDATPAGDGAVVQRFPTARHRRRVAVLLGRLTAESFPAAEVIGGGDEWLVTKQLAGQPANRPELHADPDDLVVAVGRGLRALHELPIAVIDGGPASTVRGWESIVDRCRRTVDAGLIDIDKLPYPYDRYDPGRLLAMLVDGRPRDEDPVCCQGWPTLDRFMVAGRTFSGFDRIDAMMVADRHFDLAVLHRSVQDLLGPEAVFRLYDAYGTEPDLVRLDHYVLASHLIVEPSASPVVVDGQAEA